MENLGDVQDAGWFFMSNSGQDIDGRYIFGSESSVSKDSLSFTFGSYSGSDIEIKEQYYSNKTTEIRIEPNRIWIFFGNF